MSYYLERIERGVEFIEAHLDESFTLSDVARAGGLSQWHFQRIFKSLSGETLKAYVRSRRLTMALDRLSTTDLRILDIALTAGFESQESFARAFKQAFTVTPSEFRRLDNKGSITKKPRASRDYLRQLTLNAALEPEFYQQRELRLVGMRTLFFGVDSEKNNLGERLPPLWGDFITRLSEIEPRVPFVCYGVVRQESADSECLEYYAAVEVPNLCEPPEGMEAFVLPEARRARFTHRGRAEDVDHTVSYAYGSWLARVGERHSSAADLEIYGPDYHPTSADSVIHYAIPLHSNG